MISPLNIKVIAGAAALTVGVFGGAYVAGTTSSDATAPALDSATPSRVASPSAVPTTQAFAPKVATRAAAKPKHAQDQSEQASKKHSHRNGNND